MTEFWGEIRPKGPGGKPTWLRSVVVLPELRLTPEKDGRWNLSFMRGSLAGSHWMRRICEPDELMAIIRHWMYDPEGMIQDYFGELAPDDSKERQTDTKTIIVAGVEDLF